MEKNGINFEVIPHYVDEILVDDSNTHKSLIKKANGVLIEYSMGSKYEFNEGGECSIEMEFYDGIAIATDGCGLYMTYPKLDDVAKSPARQDSIQDYTGIYDGQINQHDVALRYGVLKFGEEHQKVTKKLNDHALEHETLVVMSGDIFKEIYNMEHVETFDQAGRLVRDAALRFEKKWQEMKADDKDNMLDYILEMEDFELTELERLAKIYDC